MELMLCLVCGEIFDASLGACPVCGVGLGQCVPVEEQPVTYRNNTRRVYVILGGGIAGVTAAEAIRQRDETGKIILISAEKDLPINRTRLTKDFAGLAEGTAQKYVHPGTWYRERGIELRLGIEAIRIQPEEKRVITAEGETIEYDRLIYACGAECAVPPIPGCELAGVYTIRHLQDTLRLAEQLRLGMSAVVIGGGVLGLEAASELYRNGARVTVLEAAPQIMGRQISPETAAELLRRIRAMGVACRERVQVAALEGTASVQSVRLADGTAFPAELVVLSCGNRANLDAARNAGLTCDRAIPVDARMRTGLPDIYACGDCAALDGVNLQQWSEAMEQGRVAGANAVGEGMIYVSRPLGLNLDAFGVKLFAMGSCRMEGDPAVRSACFRDGILDRYAAFYAKNGRVIGAELINWPEKTLMATSAVMTQAPWRGVWKEDA